jgi:rubrerythrin
MASAFEIFSRAEQFERAVGELYAVIAESYPWDEGDRAIFERLAQEELQHAARVRLLAAHYRNDAALFKLDRPALDRIERAERNVEDMRAAVSAGRWQDDLPGLKAQLADLEDPSHATHAELLAEGADARVRAFFLELARQDRAHRDLLLGAKRRTAATR